MALCLACSAPSPVSELTDWKMKQEGSSNVYSVKAPCTVAGALNEAGYFGENVLEGLRYKDIDKSVFDKPWVFTTKFGVEKGKRHVLRFESLGYSADIVLNGKTLATADTTVGPFCVREFNITGMAKASNTLKVTVHKAPAQSLNHGWVDWNPRPVDETMGILGPVRLISTPDVEVKDVFVKPIVNVNDFSEARIDVEITLVNLLDKPVEGSVKASAEDISFEIPVKLEASETKVLRHTETVKNPRIWWSAEMGSPELYHMTVSFGDSHSRSVRFGIRDISSEITPDGHRQFILNGKKVLVKSAGWADDIFMQDTPESILRQVQMVKDMGLNNIRFENVWGKDDTVYDVCDSLGILTLMGFSCQWEWESYCGLPETRRNGCIEGEPWESMAVRYFHDQLIRLRNHASLIGWLTGSDRAPLPQLEERYMELYNALEYRPYVCSASGVKSTVTGPSGMKMAGPYEYVGPDYWFIDTKRGGAYGFNTETNPGMNIPQKENVERLLGGEKAWPIGPAWDYHCTASSSHMNNTKIEEAAVAGTYGEADSFEDFVKKAHALDYDSTRSMYEAFRCNIGKATGIVNWMLSSAWPSLYWQLYDWYGVPTAGYYGVKHACAPVQLIYNYGDRSVYAVNDAAPKATYSAEINFLGADSRKLIGKTVSFLSEERKPVRLEKLPAGVPGFLSLVLRDAAGNVSARNFYCIGAGGGEYAWDKADWWGIPMTGFADLSFVTALPKADVSLETTPVDGGISVKLTNNSEVVSFQNILKAFGADGNLIGGPVWEDNFISLLPGESRTVLCTAPGAEIKLDSWN